VTLALWINPLVAKASLDLGVVLSDFAEQFASKKGQPFRARKIVRA
jgi:hypothetical protein